MEKGQDFDDMLPRLMVYWDGEQRAIEQSILAMGKAFIKRLFADELEPHQKDLVLKHFLSDIKSSAIRLKEFAKEEKKNQ